MHARLKEEFDASADRTIDLAQRDGHREGKTLTGGAR
jgi:hypothetical protein